MILLKNATIICSSSEYHLKKKDILIKNGKITAIKSTIKEEGARVIAYDNLHVSIGWFDSSVSFGEPGFEERQTLKNGLQTALAGGFSTLLLNPNNKPLPTNQSSINYLKQATTGTPVSVFPVGSFTLNSNGEHLSELYDMSEAGAISFYDFKKPITNANLLKIGLQYTKSFDGIVQSYPQENSIAGKGMVNESSVALELGLKSIPNLAEELQIERDLRIAQYTGGNLHIPTVSTSIGVQLIEKARNDGVNVTCSVSAHHLAMTHDVLTDFDTNFKVQPPLRNEIDVKYLRKAALKGSIDLITSDHTPLNPELKEVEFDQATPGTIGLETCFGVINNLLPLEASIRLLTNAYEIFQNYSPLIKTEEMANLTLFNPDIEYVFTQENSICSAKNNAFADRPMRGKVLGVINNKKSIFYDAE